MPSRRDVPQCTVACDNCRTKKTRCSGTKPCTTCTAHQRECSFPNPNQRLRKRKMKAMEVEERFARVEALLLNRVEESSLVSSQQQTIPVVIQPRPSLSNSIMTAQCDPIIDGCASIPTTANTSWSHNNGSPTTITAIDPQMYDSPVPYPDIITSPIHQHRGANPRQQELGLPESNRLTINDTEMRSFEMSIDNGSIPTELSHDQAEHFRSSMQEDDNYSEHHGVSSFLSICSKSGIDWIVHQTGSSEFVTRARKFASVVEESLKLSRPLSAYRVPEPPPEDAHKWIQVFFKESFEHSIGLVPRDSFETRLKAAPQGKGNSSANLAFYALKNTVYAIGCRLDISSDGSPTSYEVARDKSWPYFENAMSVHTELLYLRSDSTAIEALVLMSFFAEAISSPAIEYLLLSNATRLAQSKGFHLQSGIYNQLSEEEREARVWLWWCIYILDKHIASRSGRPSIIDDSEASVGLPTSARRGTTSNLSFFVSSVKHAKISSLVCRSLSSARSNALPVAEILDSIRELDKMLREWRAGLDPVFQSRPTVKLMRDHPDISITQFTYLYLSYHGSLCLIHNLITYPWLKPALELVKQHDIMTQVQESSKIIAEASRAIASFIQQIEMNAASPVWLIFYFPILSQINLFIQVLQDPGSSSATSDVSLMEVVAGHFSRLEYASNSEMTFSFPRELASMAKRTMLAARERNLNMMSDANRDGDDENVVSLTDSSSYLDVPQTVSDVMDFESMEWPFVFPSFGETNLFNLDMR